MEARDAAFLGNKFKQFIGKGMMIHETTELYTFAIFILAWQGWITPMGERAFGKM
jgi:hypothetical protein